MDKKLCLEYFLLKESIKDLKIEISNFIVIQDEDIMQDFNKLYKYREDWCQDDRKYYSDNILKYYNDCKHDIWLVSSLENISILNGLFIKRKKINKRLSQIKWAFARKAFYIWKKIKDGKEL